MVAQTLPPRFSEALFLDLERVSASTTDCTLLKLWPSNDTLLQEAEVHGQAASAKRSAVYMTTTLP